MTIRILSVAGAAGGRRRSVAANGLDAGAGRPGQHGERHAEIVMVPRRAFIDHTVVALFADEHQDERVLS
jgi:hypothetical protein